MKKNLPVTQQNIEIAAGKVLVSNTDLKGIITYANRDFMEVAGYSSQELVGKNHNIVRHPDVPAVFFQDLWDTVQQGKPWTGIVKNRAKSGDHYWVVANVAPYYEDGQITGYISIRQPATTEQISLAEQLYKQAEDGEITVKSGNVYAGLSGKLARLNPLRKMGVRNKLIGMIALLSLLPLLIFGWLGSDNAREALEEQAMAKLESVAANKRASIESYFVGIHDQIDRKSVV